MLINPLRELLYSLWVFPCKYIFLIQNMARRKLACRAGEYTGLALF